jgi:hypothetical protein
MLREVIEEFGRHLDILADQLGSSLTEADRDCVSVGRSFHELSAAKATLEALPGTGPERRVLEDTCRRMGESLHTAVVGLQYHDRLAQRLELVRAALDRLQNLLRTRSPRSYGQWMQSLRDLEQINRIEQRRLGPAIGGSDADVQLPDSSTVELF